MTEAQLPPDNLLSDDDVRSILSTVSSKSEKPKRKRSTKKNEVESLRLEMDTKMTSLDEKLGSILTLFSSLSETHKERPIEEGEIVSDTVEQRPQNNQNLDTRSLQGRDISDFQVDTRSLQGREIRDCDEISLQPGQKERLDFFGSDQSSSHGDIDESLHKTSDRFSKYGKEATSDNNNNMLSETFGDDATTSFAKESVGIILDQSQIEVLSNSFRCAEPEKLTAYRDTYKHSFPVHDSADKMLAIPSLDSMVESLLIKRFGIKAAFSKSQSLHSQPLKGLEKLSYQGQCSARMGIVINLYMQQALSMLLHNLTQKSPNLDSAIQCVRDIFAMSTKSLDQVSRSGAFHHLIRRRTAMEDTGLHELKDIKTQIWNLPLSNDGVFGSGLEKTLKDRQEKNKQISELLPEVDKNNNNRKRSIPSSTVSFAPEPQWKKPRYDDKRPKNANYTPSSTYVPANRAPQNTGRPQKFGKMNNYNKSATVSSFRSFPKKN